MRSWPHAHLALWIAAAIFWTLFLAFLGLHLITPSDGARLAPDVPQSIERGLRLELLAPGGLQPDDLVLAVNGQSIDTLANNLTRPPLGAWPLKFGQTVIYTIERAGQRRDLPLALGSYPLGAVLATNWGSIAAALILQLATAYVFHKRPAEPVARVMFFSAAAMVSATTWSLGLQVADLLGKVGFWLFSVSTVGGYMLVWVGVLHAVLLFPTPWPQLVRRRWILVALYAAPYVALCAVSLLARAPNALAWLRLSGSTASYVQGCYALLALAAAVRSLRAARDPVSRAQVRWVITAFAIAFLFGLTFGVIPELVLGYPILSWDVLALIGLLVPIAFGVAILRYHLFDIDVILNRTLVYGLLTSIVIGLYVGTVGAFGTLVRLDQPLAPVLLTMLLALLILRPLHAGLQRGANRLVPAPARVLARWSAASPPPTDGEPRAPSPAPVAGPEQPPQPSKGQPAARLLAWGLFWLALALTVTGFATSLLALGESGGRGWLSAHIWFIPAATVTFATVGALVASRHPRNPIGWICGAVGVFSGLNMLVFAYRMSADVGAVALPGIEIARWLNLWVWIPATILPSTFLLLLFPDGRLPSARWWPAGWSAGLGIAAYTFGTALHPNPSIEPTATPNPFGIPGTAGALDLLVSVAFILLAVGSAGSVAALVVRFRRSRGLERAQLKWLAYAAVVGLLGNVGLYAWDATRPHDVLAYDVSLIGIMVMLVAIAAATGIAILRYRLYDIDILINRTLVYGVLTAFIVGLYVLVVGVSGELLHQTGSLVLSLLVTGLIAILFQPLRERLQRFVNRLLYGERDDPYAVLSRLGRQLEATLAPEAVLPALVETIAQTLKLPYVAIALQPENGSRPEIVAAYGLPGSSPTRLPLTYQSESVGALLISPRGPGETFNAAEQRLLADIANRAGVAVHAVRLTADLQRSRERLVTAREEERRRLRRDLHDGLGPQLASQTLTLTAARQLLRQSPAEAEALLTAAIQHAKDAVTDIRRVVYDLRPPALDDLGLVGALRAQAAEYEASGVRFSVTVPESLPPLPAAVEVACYRIAQEALTNVVKHANAAHCAVTLALDGAVHLEISDDGRGLPANRRAGVGLTSMRERAEELGGHCLVEPAAGGGTRVRASLPRV